MKVVTLDNIEWIESPNYQDGRMARLQSIVIHWWGAPSTNPQMNGVISWFQRADVEVSAHFVVSGDRIVQMVNMGDTAWHAMQANPYTIGIEVDPNVPGNTYETVGALVKFIRGYYGDLPLKKHSDYVSTACPGHLNLPLIEDYSRDRVSEPVPVPAPAPAPKPLYKVYNGTVQLGAYSVEKNAYDAFKLRGGTRIMLGDEEVTAALVSKFEPAPAPVPPPVPTGYSEADRARDNETASLVAQIFKLLKSVWGSLTSLHKKV